MMENKVNVYRALQEMRVDLQEMDINKTGHNDYGKYDYFELSDFLPEINKLALNKNIICIYEITKEEAILHIADVDNTENQIVFKIPIAEIALKGANAIQNIGGLTTYTRRYLYMIAFEIAGNDEFDASESNDTDNNTKGLNKEEINNAPIDQTKINSLLAVMERKGVSQKAIHDRYEIKKLEDMSLATYIKCMAALEKTPDKE